MLYDLGEALIQDYQSQDFEEFRVAVLRGMALEPPFDKETFRAERVEPLSDQLFEKATVVYRDKNKRIGEWRKGYFYNLRVS